tara:strand:+ start:42 stop:1070 length:1029 start_codon:yes stop_codon:yes gene_type:complete
MAVGSWSQPYGDATSGSGMETLVFPRSKPYGANSTSSQDAISKDKRKGTEVVDYLKITIYDPKEGANSSYNYVKENHVDTDTVKKSIYLYLPNKLREGYQAKYNGVKLGPLGGAALGGINDAIGEGGLNTESLGDSIKEMADAAIPTAGFNLGANMINEVLSRAGGGGLTGNNLAALTTGKVFNPYEETVFQGMQFRDHKFDFLFAPKSQSDVETITDIIETFRISMLPGKDGDHWLTIPDYFRVEIVRLVSNEEEEILYPTTGAVTKGVLQKIMQFPSKMILANMDVDLSPYGPYASLKSVGGDDTYDFGPVAYRMSLSFKETSLLSRESYGYNTKGEKIK